VGLGPLAFETFNIQMVVPSDFPLSLPKVFETFGRIPRSSDNHINSDGSICYGVPHFIIARRPKLTMAEFVSEVLFDYFLGYLHFQEFGEWPFGEIGHGHEGVTDHLAERLGCESSFNKVAALIVLLSKKHRRDRWVCPCGSRKTLGMCCRKALNHASLRLSKNEALGLLPLASELFSCHTASASDPKRRDSIRRRTSAKRHVHAANDAGEVRPILCPIEHLKDSASVIPFQSIQPEFCIEMLRAS
jgi:hypothetical protein